MLYKFKSKAAADLIMLAEHAEPILKCWGKEVSPKGILLSADMARAMAQLESAIALHGAEPSVNTDRSQGSGEMEMDASSQAVKFGARAQPMLAMMRLALRDQADIVWGV
jgi:cyclopropane-fatty-acyl-phospholipid synthase